VGLYELIMSFLGFIVVFVLVRIWFVKGREYICSTFTQHVPVEFLWTVLPLVILFAIGLPRVSTVYCSEAQPAPTLTVKVTGRQWY
jgi:heme/copper-type cytochrome/quinol oxidase subunit 2